MKRTLAVLTAAALAAACTGETEPAPDDQAGCGTELTAPLSHWADAGFSGSIAVTAEGAFQCRAAFGLADTATDTPNTAETVFAIGSVSKAFTAAATFDLVHTGALDLDDSAGEHLPELTGPASEATIEQLLLHTSGLTGSHGTDHRPLSRHEAIDALSAMDTAFAPGTDYLYSNGGYTLLALIIDRAAETGYRDHLAERILTVPDRGRIGGFWDGEPAAGGPRATGYADGEPAASTGGFSGPHWALDGNGDLAMTAADLAQWTSALFAGDIVAPEAVEELTATGHEHGDGATEIPGWVTIGPEQYGAPVTMAEGGGGDTGHHAVVAHLPDTGQTIAVTSNTDDITAADLLEAIGPALAAGEPLPVPEGHDTDIEPDRLAQHTGTYTLDTGGTYTVTAGPDGLTATAAGGDAVAAMFQATADFTAADVQRHETAVLDLLEGRTDAGAEERDAVEATLGAIEHLEPAGTTVEERELRTYITITGTEQTRLAWYALDDHGGIAAAWLEAEPPAFTLVPTGDGDYRRQHLNGAGAGLRVRFDDDTMTVTGADGTVEARRAG